MKNYKLVPAALIIMLCIGLFSTTRLVAQNVSVNNTGAPPDASAILDVNAPGKGLLIPRMTKAERPATPAQGLMIYQTDDKPGFYFYKVSAWTRVMDSTNTSGGTIIPFSSGTAITFNFQINTPGDNHIIGLGNYRSIAPGPVTDATAASFVAPRNGTITSISGQLTAASGFLNFSNTTINVTVYTAAAGTSTFTPTTASLLFSFPPGFVTAGTYAYSVEQGMALPVTAGSRYMLVITGVQSSSSYSFNGYFSGAVNIY